MCIDSLWPVVFRKLYFFNILQDEKNKVKLPINIPVNQIFSMSGTTNLFSL